jgi:hypothetical protein
MILSSLCKNGQKSKPAGQRPRAVQSQENVGSEVYRGLSASICIRTREVKPKNVMRRAGDEILSRLVGPMQPSLDQIHQVANDGVDNYGHWWTATE